MNKGFTDNIYSEIKSLCTPFVIYFIDCDWLLKGNKNINFSSRQNLSAAYYMIVYPFLTLLKSLNLM